MKNTVIYHSADYNGIFCREIARKFLPDAELIGWNFGDGIIPLSSQSEMLYVLDLPLDRPFGFDFSKPFPDGITPPNCPTSYENIVWIDHHKSSIESHPQAIPGYRIDGVAACRLAWQWFTAMEAAKMKEGSGMGCHKPELPSKQDFIDSKVAEPIAVRLAGEYDIWDKRDPRAEMFQYGLRSRELTEFDWSDMLSMKRATIEEIEQLIAVGHRDLLEPDGSTIPAIVSGLLSNGAICQRYAQQADASICKSRTWLMEWEGLKFLCVNSARFNSLLFAAKDLPETGHDALLGFCYDGKCWTVSLYHARHRTDLDLSQIAMRHGGGSHRGACGFTCLKLPFDL